MASGTINNMGAGIVQVQLDGDNGVSYVKYCVRFQNGLLLQFGSAVVSINLDGGSRPYAARGYTSITYLTEFTNYPIVVATVEEQADYWNCTIRNNQLSTFDLHVAGDSKGSTKWAHWIAIGEG